jgi:hypothetical protein
MYSVGYDQERETPPCFCEGRKVAYVRQNNSRSCHVEMWPGQRELYMCVVLVHLISKLKNFLLRGTERVRLLQERFISLYSAL